MRPILLERPLALALLSVALVSVAWHVPHAWPFIFVALIPSIHGVLRARSWRSAALLGALVGSGIVGQATLWLFAARPLLTLIGFSHLFQISFVFVGWLLVALITGPVVAVFALEARAYKRLSILDVLALSVLWVSLESVRMYLFNVLTYSSKVANPPFWSTGFIGYPLADSASWLQLALGGVSLMSFVVIAVNLVIYRIMRSSCSRTQKRLRLVSIACIIAAISLLPVVALREANGVPNKESVRIGILSVGVPRESYGEPRYQNQTGTIVENLLSQGAYTVLLPEGFGYTSVMTPPFPASISSDARVVGSQYLRHLDGSSALESVVFTPDGRMEGVLRDKLILTPEGEYLAGILRIALHAFSRTERTQAYAGGHMLTNARDIGQPLVASDARMSVMFCFEVFAPGFARRLVSLQQADMVAVVMSHGSFYRSRSLEDDTLRFLKVQAVEAGVPLVSSGNAMPGYALDRYGRVLSRVGGDGVSRGEVVSVPIRR